MRDLWSPLGGLGGVDSGRDHGDVARGRPEERGGAEGRHGGGRGGREEQGTNRGHLRRSNGVVDSMEAAMRKMSGLRSVVLRIRVSQA